MGREDDEQLARTGRAVTLPDRGVSPAPVVDDRYADLGPSASGGMGEVRPCLGPPPRPPGRPGSSCGPSWWRWRASAPASWPRRG
ncbi:MAG: hypothetical protein R3F43_24935 [bacterium]